MDYITRFEYKISSHMKHLGFCKQIAKKSTRMKMWQIFQNEWLLLARNLSLCFPSTGTFCPTVQCWKESLQKPEVYPVLMIASIPPWDPLSRIFHLLKFAFLKFRALLLIRLISGFSFVQPTECRDNKIAAFPIWWASLLHQAAEWNNFCHKHGSDTVSETVSSNSGLALTLTTTDGEVRKKSQLWKNKTYISYLNFQLFLPSFVGACYQHLVLECLLVVLMCREPSEDTHNVPALIQRPQIWHMTLLS